MHDSARRFYYQLVLVSLVSVIISCVNHQFVPAPDCVDVPVIIELQGTVQHATCGVGGEFGIDVDAGGRPYKLYLNGAQQVNGADMQELTFDGLPSGSYLLKAEDDRGCTGTLMVNIDDMSSGMKITSSTQPDDQCFGSNGVAMVHVAGAQGPYSLYINDHFIQAGDQDEIEIKNLEAGVYNLKVVDSASCSHQTALTIPRGLTSVSWTNDVHPIIKTYCAKSGCHIGETGRVDFSSFENVKIYASQIRTKIQNRSMPYDGPLRDDYIALITCWIDDGSLSN